MKSEEERRFREPRLDLVRCDFRLVGHLWSKFREARGISDKKSFLFIDHLKPGMLSPSPLLILYSKPDSLLAAVRAHGKWIEFDREDRRESQWPAAASWELANATVGAESLLCQREIQWLQNTCAPLSAVTLDKALSGDEHHLCVTSSLVTDFSSVLLLIGLLIELHSVLWPRP